MGYALELSGFISPDVTQSVAEVIQPESALMAIRVFIGPVPMVLLLLALVLAYFYPINRQKHEEILLRLAERHRQQSKEEI